MKRKILLLALPIIIGIVCSCSQNKDNADVSEPVNTDISAYSTNTPTPVLSDTEADKLNKSFTELVFKDDAPLSSLGVSILNNDKIIYKNTFGFANTETKKELCSNSKFRIASVSKLITSIGVMQLVDKGLINLDNDVSDYLGFNLRNPSFLDTPITMRMLLSHMSSFSDEGQYTADNGISLEDLIYSSPDEYFSPLKPGTYFQYANINFGIAATVMECVTHERFDKYMRKNVFSPLGLDCTYNNIGDLSAQTRDNFAVIYEYAPDGWTPACNLFDPKAIRADAVSFTEYGNLRSVSLENYTIGKNALIFSPHGGVRASLDDLSTIALMLINKGEYNGNRILSQQAVVSMLSPEWLYDGQNPNGDVYRNIIKGYGLGTQYVSNSDTDKLCKNQASPMAGHFGDAYGLIDGIMVDYKNKKGFVFIIGGTSRDIESYISPETGYTVWEDYIMNEAINVLNR